MESSKEQVAAILTSALVSKLEPKLLSLNPVKDKQAEYFKEEILQTYKYFLEKLGNYKGENSK